MSVLAAALVRHVMQVLPQLRSMQKTKRCDNLACEAERGGIAPAVDKRTLLFFEQKC